jgi:hypothetical protein
MNDAPEDELEAALVELEAMAAQGAPGAKGLPGRLPERLPGRWEARAVLIPLGRLILARGEAALREPLQRIRAATTASAKAWAAALDEELALACAEHVQGTDPRYLALANFDWEYVLSARERLEARVVAARALGRDPQEALWGQVLEADLRVREHTPGA